MSEPGLFKSGDTLLNKYRIEQLIGSGSMGSTYLARDESSGKTIALKIVALNHIKEWKELELFEREVTALKNLDHPRIPDYIDNFETEITGEKIYVLVQEYVDGQDLNRAVKNGTAFTPVQVLDIFRQLLEILDYIHNLKPAVIHRDINPKNIIMDKAGRVHLIDFGAAGKLSKTTISAGNNSTFAGTPGYMPQEQYYGKISTATDMYALGVTVLFLFTGKQPAEFEREGLRISFHNLPDLPDYAVRLLQKMTEPVMEQRQASAAQALKILKRRTFPEDIRITASLREIAGQLIRAEQEADYDRLDQIIKKLDSVNLCDRSRRSLLKIILDQNNTRLAQFLVHHGADVNIQFKGRSLLHDAVINGNYQNAEWLLKNKALTEIRDDRNKWTPLEYAYDCGYEKIKQLLLSHGARDTVKEQQEFIYRQLPAGPRKVPVQFRFKLRSELKQSNTTRGMYTVWLFFCVLAHFFIGSSPRIINELLLILAVDKADTAATITRQEVFKLPWLDKPANMYFYSFQTPDGRMYKDYSFDSYEVYRGKEPVTVEYLPWNPAVSRLSKMHCAFLPEGLAVAGLVIFWMMALFYAGIWFFPNYRKTIRLFKKGLVAGGLIKKNYKSGGRRSVNSVYYDQYEYTDQINHTLKQGEHGNFHKYFALQKSKVPVLYLPQPNDYSFYLPPLLIWFKEGRWVFKKKIRLVKHTVFTVIRYSLGVYMIGFALAAILELIF